MYKKWPSDKANHSCENTVICHSSKRTFGKQAACLKFLVAIYNAQHTENYNKDFESIKKLVIHSIFTGLVE